MRTHLPGERDVFGTNYPGSIIPPPPPGVGRGREIKPGGTLWGHADAARRHWGGRRTVYARPVSGMTPDGKHTDTGQTEITFSKHLNVRTDAMRGWERDNDATNCSEAGSADGG